jgi:hypothetical protein
VSIVTKLRAGRSEFEPLKGREIFSFSAKRPDTLCGLPSLYSMDTGVKRPEREVDNSPPSSSEVKN